MQPCEMGQTVSQPGLLCTRCGNGTLSLFPRPDTDPLHACTPCADVGGAGSSLLLQPSQTRPSVLALANGGLTALPPASALMCSVGGSVAFAQPGYWRAGNTSLTAVACPFTAACDEAATGVGGCLPGYSGRACSRCATGFGRRGSECVACLATGVGGFVALMLLLLLAATLLLTWWAWVTTVSYQRAAAAVAASSPVAASSLAPGSEGSWEPSTPQLGMRHKENAGTSPQASTAPQPSSLLMRAVPAPKLLLDHAQALQVASSLQLVWPPAVLTMLGWVSVASSTADAGYLVQWDCAVQVMAPVPVASVFVATQVIIFLVPFLLLGAAVAVLAAYATGAWFCYRCGRRRVLTAAPPAAGSAGIKVGTGAAAVSTLRARLSRGALVALSGLRRRMAPVQPAGDAAAACVLPHSSQPAATADVGSPPLTRQLRRWWIETTAAACIALCYILHTTETQRLAFMLACTAAEDTLVIPALSDGPLPLQQPDWANITSVRLTGGAWVVTERASYALADQGLLCSGRLAAAGARIYCAGARHPRAHRRSAARGLAALRCLWRRSDRLCARFAGARDASWHDGVARGHRDAQDGRHLRRGGAGALRRDGAAHSWASGAHHQSGVPHGGTARQSGSCEQAGQRQPAHSRLHLCGRPVRGQPRASPVCAAGHQHADRARQRRLRRSCAGLRLLRRLRFCWKSELLLPAYLRPPVGRV